MIIMDVYIETRDNMKATRMVLISWKHGLNVSVVYIIQVITNPIVMLHVQRKSKEIFR